jgi:TonB-dependent receptor
LKAISTKFAAVSPRVRALSVVSALAICAAYAGPVAAQESIDEETPAGTPEAVEDQSDQGDEIVVTGFRASLQSAQRIKRDADTVVDVITAEDIGALPDRSVAEALQRVPGVNISRFEQRDDPDRFSVEGSGVIIRGLPFVQSELNGRDIFSANGGRTLSFNDVSPELLGRVEVYKNNTADMIDGGISGTVNLVTRKPLDSRGFKLAGTLEGNYGDMAKEWSPGFSGLLSNTFDSGIGTFGVQVAYAQSELVTRTDASQITDPCYRAPSLTAGCQRVLPVGSGGIGGGAPLFNESNFPPAGSVIVPKGAGVRTTDLTRDRKAYSGVLQWESRDKRALVTLEYLRAESGGRLNEYAVLAQVNDDALFPTVAPGTTPTYRGPQVDSITLTQNSGVAMGIPTELLRFQREDDAMTEDFSLDIDVSPTDRLKFNMEFQHIRSNRSENGLIAANQTFADVAIDNRGNTPVVQFLRPGTATSPAGYFNDPALTYYWFMIDNQVRNSGELNSMRVDGEYDVSDTGFFRKARFGARWAERNRVTRSANFSNWGNLSAPWQGRNGDWGFAGVGPGAYGGGAYISDFPNFAQVRNPFGDDFQRGSVPVPLGDGSAFFFGGDNLVEEYLSGVTERQARDINDFSLSPNRFTPIYNRNGVVAGTPFLPGEISDVDESTSGAYFRADFAHDFDNGMTLDGNIGVRYVKTEIRSGGTISFPAGDFFDVDTNGDGIKDGDGITTVQEVQASCARTQPGQQAPGYCSLSPARLAQFAASFTGDVVDDSAAIRFSNWLPSFNAKLDVGDGLLFRVAASKAISRPDLAAFRTGGAIFDNTGDLRASGTLETGPLFQIFTGNRLLRPIQSWNFDLSAEWYFDRVGSLTLALFAKDMKGIVNDGALVRTFTSPGGVSTDVEVNGPSNNDNGLLKGAELAYQQTYEFLPGPLSGLGSQLVYTYVDAGDFNNSTLGAAQSPFSPGLPLAGVSKHTVNAVLFYEHGPFSARAAYNWRSGFLQTPRDVIFPFSPIYGESTGQLDASIFVTVNKRLKLGIQGVNLLDEVTRTSQVVDFDGTRATRSAFRNDRRFTLLARFDF